MTERKTILKFIACYTRFSLMDIREYDEFKLRRLLFSISRDPLVEEVAREWAERVLKESEE